MLSKASPRTFSIKAKNWSESAQRFLKQCAEAGNVEACYTLGMVSIKYDITIKFKKKKTRSMNLFFAFNQMI